MFYKLILILSFLTTFSLHGEDKLNFCYKKELESVPVLSSGRIRPYLAHSTEQIKYLIGRGRMNRIETMRKYCLLSHSFLEGTIATGFDIVVSSYEIKKILNVPRHQKSVPLHHLLNNSRLLRLTLENSHNQKLKNDLSILLRVLNFSEEILSGHNWKVPYKGEWISLRDYYSKTRESSLEEEWNNFAQQNGSSYLLENIYIKLNLLGISIGLIMVSLILLIWKKEKNYYLIPLSLTFITQAATLAIRGFIAERVPFSNMYETVLLTGLFSLLITYFLYRQVKTKFLIGAGLLLNLFILFLLKFSGGMLDDSIKPLLPVLRNNFWLSIHVTSVMVSYTALAIGWVVSNIYMCATLININMDKNKSAHIIHRATLVGVSLLGIGIITGAIWADYAWGRFWGWDPKETWSLIVLLLYVIVLHGRYSGWIKLKHFVPLGALCFLSVIMAWFGVNYILASGLHSYGFSQGGTLFVLAFFFIQIIVWIFYEAKIRVTKGQP